MNDSEESNNSGFLSRPSTRPSQGATSPVGSERSSRLSAQFNQSSTNQQQQSQPSINQNPFGSRNGNRSTSGSISLTESTPSLHDPSSESSLRGTDSSFHSPTSNAPSNSGTLDDRNSDPSVSAVSS